MRFGRAELSACTIVIAGMAEPSLPSTIPAKAGIHLAAAGAVAAVDPGLRRDGDLRRRRSSRTGLIRLTLRAPGADGAGARDRKSTRLNSSHVEISYAVFCLKKKKKKQNIHITKKKKKKQQNQ